MCLILYTCLVILLYYILRYLWELIPLGDLQSKVVFITGCDTGFGRLLTEKCAQNGISVFAGVYSEQGSNELNNLKDKWPGTITAVRIDVTNDKSVEEASQFVKEHLGDQKLWAIVNNAGIFRVCGPDDWCTAKDYEQTFNVNTLGTVRVTHLSLIAGESALITDAIDKHFPAGLPHAVTLIGLTMEEQSSLVFKPLIKKSKGRVVTITSIAGRLAFFGCGPYATSKFGTEAYMDVLRQEMKQFGVSCHIIEPGIFKTAIIGKEAMNARVNEAWKNLDDSIKSEYGEEYRDRYSRHWNYFFQEYGTTHLEYVVDNYYHAITARYPRLRYRCGWDALFLIPLSYLPTEIFDFITCVIFPMIIGFPCYIKNTVQKK